MTKRSAFTRHEIAVLRKLIREKQTASRERQKAIRARMRRLGFYISEYADRTVFVESDLDDLIRRGAIEIID